MWVCVCDCVCSHTPFFINQSHLARLLFTSFSVSFNFFLFFIEFKKWEEKNTLMFYFSLSLSSPVRLCWLNYYNTLQRYVFCFLFSFFIFHFFFVFVIIFYILLKTKISKFKTFRSIPNTVATVSAWFFFSLSLTLAFLLSVVVIAV